MKEVKGTIKVSPEEAAKIASGEYIVTALSMDENGELYLEYTTKATKQSKKKDQYKPIEDTNAKN